MIRKFRLMAVMAGLVILAGCVAAFSTDPVLAAKQQWITGCKAADSNIQIVGKLYKAGQLSESAASKIDDVVDLYDVICTGDPPAPDMPIASIAAKALAAKVCPLSAPTNIGDWKLTLIDAAACAAEGALLAEAT